MQDITIQRWDINVEALTAELRAALGKPFAGLSTGPHGVIVHFTDGANPAQVQQTRYIVENHDSTVLTPDQQARLSRQQKLEQARLENVSELDSAIYNGLDENIRQLAQKVAWLEQEILAQRGL